MEPRLKYFILTWNHGFTVGGLLVANEIKLIGVALSDRYSV